MALAVIAVASIAVVGTGRSAAHAQIATPATEAPFVVLATIKPLHALTAAVLGDVAKTELLIYGGASPHTYALKPSQVRLLNEATAVVMVSSDLETFIEKVVTSLPKSVAVVKVDGAAGLQRWPVREGGLFEGHDHGGGSSKASGRHDHSHDHGDKRSASTKKAQAYSGELDPHLWLDPDNAKAIVMHLAKVFSDLHPKHRATFEKNSAAMIARLDVVTADIKRELKPVEGKRFIVFHDAYQYFERRFGLMASGSITLNPDVQPGARRLKELRGRIQAGGMVCVFAEPQFEPKLITTLIEGTKVRKGTLDPIGIAVPPGPEAYETLVRTMATDFRTCLGATS